MGQDSPEPTPTPQAAPPGRPAGTGTLQRPGEAPREVPLMSIQEAPDRIAVPAVTKETGVADILLGSLGLVAVVVLGSLVLGAVLGGVLVLIKHRLGFGGPDRDEDDHISITADR